MRASPRFNSRLVLIRGSFRLIESKWYALRRLLGARGRGHRDEALFARRLAVAIGEVVVHTGTRRMRVNLHEKLTDHFSSQSFTRPGELRGCFPRTGFAGEADG